MFGCATPKDLVVPYEAAQYDKSLYKGTLFATDLCVSKEDTNQFKIETPINSSTVGLFDITKKTVSYGTNIHQKLFPASTAKVLTALIAFKYGTLSDVVTVSSRATTELDKESSVAGLNEGDTLTLEDLLYGLMLPSGNDAAVAIAEHISGTQEAFVELMNQEANALGATNSHFMNPHGLQDENHYTTVYDLYLFLNQALKDDRFTAIIKSMSYSPHITQADGAVRTGVKWTPTNYYATGKVEMPTNVTVVGGKTGTTNEAGSCLILLEQDENQNSYISIVMGAESKNVLYQDMTALITSIPTS